MLFSVYIFKFLHIIEAKKIQEIYYVFFLFAVAIFLHVGFSERRIVVDNYSNSLNSLLFLLNHSLYLFCF